MALKVAELFAELGIDSRSMERDADRVITLTARNMMRLADSAEQAGTESGRRLAEGLRRAADQGGPLLDASTLYSSRAEFERAAEDIGRSTGDGVGSGILDGMPDLSGGIGGLLEDALSDMPAAVGGPALAAGAAVGALLASGVATALEQGQIESRFEAALGVNEATAARLGEMAGDIYASNFGDSMEQVAESVRLVGQNFAGVADLSAEELAKVNTYALNTANVFDQDLRIVINAVSQLMRTGLAKNAEEAFDIITVGLGKPANKADDLLETFNEYSTLFREMGISGEEALGLINQMVEAGARDADKAADAIGEFSKRARDGSETTAAGFEAIGLNAAVMAERVSAGGGTAAEALDDTLDRLRTLDGAAQEAAGVALFGTQWEDLGDAILAADLDTAVAQLGEVDGAAQRSADSFDDMGSNLETVRRQLQNLFADFAGRKLDPLANLIGDQDKSAADYGAAAGQSYVDALIGQMGILSTVQLLPDDFWDKYGPKASFEAAMRGDWWFPDDKATEVGQATGAAFAQGARDGARGGPPLLDLDAIAADAGPARASLEDINREIELAGDLFDLAADRAGNYLDRIASSSGLDDMLGTTLDLADATRDAAQWIGDLSRSVDVSDIANGITKPAEDTAAVLQEWIDVGTKAQGAIAGVLQFQGADAATARASQIRDQLVGMMDDAGYTQDQITELLEVMGLSDWQIEAAVTLSGVDEALAKLDLLQERFKGMVPEPIQAQIDFAIAEGRFEDAGNLLSMWVKDREDGFLNDPLLVAIMANTDPATGEVDTWKAGEEGKPGPDININADTSPGQAQIDAWRRRLAQQDPARVKVALEFITKGLPALPIFGKYLPTTDSGIPGGFDDKPRRAGGGPVVGPGGPTDDMVPVDASNGEWVIKASTVSKFGPDVMAMINSGRLPTVVMPTMPESMQVPTTPMPALTTGGQATTTRTDPVLVAKLDELIKNLDRPNVTIPTEIRTTAGPGATLAEIRAHVEAGIIASMGPG